MFLSHHYNTAQCKERPRNGGPDEGMWTSHYLEGMGYECIPGSTSRSLGSDNSDANRSAKNTIFFNCCIIRFDLLRKRTRMGAMQLVAIVIVVAAVYSHSCSSRYSL